MGFTIPRLERIVHVKIEQEIHVLVAGHDLVVGHGMCTQELEEWVAIGFVLFFVPLGVADFAFVGVVDFVFPTFDTAFATTSVTFVTLIRHDNHNELWCANTLNMLFLRKKCTT